MKECKNLTNNRKPVAYGRRMFLKSSMALAATSMIPLYARTGFEDGISFAILSDLHFQWQGFNNYTKYRDLVNSLNVNFVVLNGDNINDDGPNLQNGVRIWERFDENYNKFYSDYLSTFKKNIKIYPVMGNHDPFFPAQRISRIMVDLMKEESFMLHHRELVKKCTNNRYDMEFYSWDEGDWHFLTIPCGGTGYLETLDIFNWMDKDLSMNKHKPTIVFMHVPPIGIGMADSYFIDVQQKGRFLDIFSRYGNVKYVFSGHIHNGTKVTVRSARNYKGTNYVVCPTHIWNQRPFGVNQKYKEELDQGAHGIIVGYLKKDKAELYSVLPDKSRLNIPDSFKGFTYESNPVNFYPMQNLPVKEDQINVFGDKRLDGWLTNFAYLEETNPSFIREVSKDIKRKGKTPVHMVLKGRTHVAVDFQNLGQSNNVFKYYDVSGNSKKCKVTISYMIETLNWAETDLSKHRNPSGERISTGRFRYLDHYNMGYILIALMKNNHPVFQYEANFGRWEKGPSSRAERDFTVYKYNFGVFDYGEWQHPKDIKSVVHEYDLNIWKTLKIDFAKEFPESIDFDRILVSINQANDGLFGHEMSLYFDDVSVKV
jgi:predicted MPP superfamily phosphohydrolase